MKTKSSPNAKVEDDSSCIEGLSQLLDENSAIKGIEITACEAAGVWFLESLDQQIIVAFTHVLICISHGMFVIQNILNLSLFHVT